MPFTTLLPLYARDILGVGPSGQGFLLTFMGFGALTSSFLIASIGDRMPRGMVMLVSAFVYGLGVIGFGVSTWLGLSLGIMVLTGACNVFTHALIQTIVQAYSPPELRGRMMGILQMNQVCHTVGSMLVGGLATVLGAPASLVIMGAACSAGAVAVFVSIPHARTIR
jgi:MFS family permease